MIKCHNCREVFDTKDLAGTERCVKHCDTCCGVGENIEFNCKDCDPTASFPSFAELSKHKMTVHEVAISAKRICTICDLVHPHRKAKEEHMLEAHNIKEGIDKPYVCSMCGESYTRQAMLGEHMIKKVGGTA